MPSIVTRSNGGWSNAATMRSRRIVPASSVSGSDVAASGAA
jgi:hypothetical protein